MRFKSLYLTAFLVIIGSDACSLSFEDYAFDGVNEDAGGREDESDARADGRDAADGDRTRDAASRDTGGRDTGGRDAGDDSGVDAATKCNTTDECDDGDPCNGQERCGANKTCENGEPVVCPDADDPCEVNLCVDDNGSGVCKLQRADDGTPCNDDDDTSDPEDECRLDFRCDDGDCVAETVETCVADQCEQLAGCEADAGCVYEPAPDTTSCNDDDPCTESDHCSGSDNTCVGASKDCDDEVDCTEDICDEDGNCENVPNDELCSLPCQTGICDAELDCQNTNETDFIACDDGSSATSPDFCYLGNCLGGRGRSPSASCAVGGCDCSEFGTVSDLEYVSGEYVALIDATQTAGGFMCIDGTIAIVYDVDPSGLTPYTADGIGGALRGSGSDLHSSYALANASSGVYRAGILDVSGKAVDWFDNYLSTAIDNDTPQLGYAASIASHSTGVALGGTMHLWIVGQDSTTNTTGRIIRCSWATCLVAPCPDPAPVCKYETMLSNGTYVAMRPYTHASSDIVFSFVYDGAVAAVSFENGATYSRRIYSDGTDKNYNIDTVSLSDTQNFWNGLTRYEATGTLFYGQLSNNLAYCDDTDQNGAPTCTVMTGLPEQDTRVYLDATTTPNGGMALIASDCISLCTAINYYLLVLPAGADPRDATAWNEYFLASWSGFGPSGQTPSEVAAGGDSIYVLGRSASDGNPYLWVFAP